MPRLTKVELEQINARLSAELCELRAEISRLKAQNEMLHVPCSEQLYPLVDRTGKHYRLETIHGRTIKCYQPEKNHAH